MKKPNAERFNPEPDYLRELLDKLREYGWARTRVCAEIGVPYRTMTDYLNGTTGHNYTVQYSVESLLYFVSEFHSDLQNSSSRTNIGRTRPIAALEV